MSDSKRRRNVSDHGDDDGDSDEYRLRPQQARSRPRRQPDRKSPPAVRASTRGRAESPSDIALDRDWYAGDDNGQVAFGDDYHGAFADAAASYATPPTTVSTSSVSGPDGRNTRRQAFREAQWKRDTDAWEANRMVTSGVAQRIGAGRFGGTEAGRTQASAGLDDDDDGNSGKRVHVLVHELRPPFLDGHVFATAAAAGPVSVLRDPNGDMASMCQRGSKAVVERRAQQERARQAAAAADVRGTALGNILGVPDKDGIDDVDGRRPGGDQLEKREADAAQSAFSQTKSLREQRQFLPAYAVRNELLRVIREHQVVVVVGQTGSGKTTQLAQFLSEDGYTRSGLIIGCTQPRRVAAMSVAKRVAAEMGVKLGGPVGYAIRFEDCTSAETKVKFMTDGVLLREALTTPDLDRYGAVIMDEAHERALNTDVLLGLLKRVLARRRDLKLIVTSATMNAARFSAFFGGAPEFVIPGRTFPVDIRFARVAADDYVAAAVRQILAIHLSGGAGDILVFMTGQDDIEATCALVAARLEQLHTPPPLAILPIYSQLPADLQARIFERSEAGVRKLVVATNIAETSLTVDGVAFVIDAGLAKIKVFNPAIGMDALQLAPIAQANAAQRSGRAGRTGPGTCYRLYTDRNFRDELLTQPVPEIRRTNLANTVLLLKSLGVDDPRSFPFLDPPPAQALSASLFDLWALGALDHAGELTRLGRLLAAFPMDPPLAKLLIVALDYGCIAEMCSIVAMLSVPPVFHRPNDRQADADRARDRLSVSESDHLTLLNVFGQWRMNGCRDGWCSEHFLHSRSLRRALDIRRQIVDILRTNPAIGLVGPNDSKFATTEDAERNLPSCGIHWDIIRRCICAGYFHHAARAHGLGRYVNLRTSVSMALHPTSALTGLGLVGAEYVVYHELVLTSKEYMSCVTAVDPHWLADYGAVFYALKKRAYTVSGVDDDDHPDSDDTNPTHGSSTTLISRKAEIEAEMNAHRRQHADRLVADKAKADAARLDAAVRTAPGQTVTVGGHGRRKKGPVKLTTGSGPARKNKTGITIRPDDEDEQDGDDPTAVSAARPNRHFVRRKI